MGNLTTLADQKIILQIDASDTSSDTYLNLLISLISSQIESFLDRKLAVADYVENIAPSNTQILQMRQWPINTVAYVNENTVPMAVNVDYFIYPQYISSGQIYRGVGWNGQPYSRGLTYDPYANQITLEVSYNAGYNLPGDNVQTHPLPADISMCCQLMVAQQYAKVIAGNTGDAFKMVKDGDLAYSFDNPSDLPGDLFGINGGMPTQFANILNKYRRWVVG
jgi:hypothetical protein